MNARQIKRRIYRQQASRIARTKISIPTFVFEVFRVRSGEVQKTVSSVVEAVEMVEKAIRQKQARLAYRQIISL
jgi:hypothetical protein